MTPCVLCASTNTTRIIVNQSRTYFDCSECGLVSLSPEFRITYDQELARYKLHNNSPEDSDYIKFLSRAVAPLERYLKPGMIGLDYGCGPGPAIPMMLAEKGCEVELYDPFFYPREFSESDSFDFIISTETIEHFFSPAQEFLKIRSLIKAGGLLAVMTEVLDENQDFASWWYVKDPTHVSFYRSRTLSWIAGRYGWQIDAPHRNVRIFRTAEV